MKKNFILFVLSVLSTCGLYAQYVAPSEGVFRIVNVEYGAVISENFVSGNLQCAAVGDSEDYEQMWILKPSGSHYTIQNVFTGRYIQTGNSGTEVPYWTGVAAKQFSIVKSNQWEGYNIWDTGLAAGQGLHIQSVYTSRNRKQLSQTLLIRKRKCDRHRISLGYDIDGRHLNWQIVSCLCHLDVNSCLICFVSSCSLS